MATQYRKNDGNLADTGITVDGISIIEPGTDLTGKDLSGAVLTDADLTGAVFSGAVLRNTKFIRSNLSNSFFSLGEKVGGSREFGFIQLGDDIDGESAYDQSGYSVSLSSDGSIVAIGATGNDGNGSNSGHVRVYQRDKTNTTVEPIGWIQLGEDINGEAAFDQSGYSVSLSNDGTTVAIGARYNDSNHSNSGHVRVYNYKIPTSFEWDNENVIKGDDTTQVSNKYYWTQLGSDIQDSYNQSGMSVSLSGDGSIVVIGAPYTPPRYK